MSERELRIVTLRHAEGLHNKTRNSKILDPKLTDKGRGQARIAGHHLAYAAKELGVCGWYVVVSPHVRTLQTLRGALGDTAIEKLIKEKNIIISPLIAEVHDPLPTFEAVALATTYGQYHDEFIYDGTAISSAKLCGPKTLVPWVHRIPAENLVEGNIITGREVWAKEPYTEAESMRARLPKAREFLYGKMHLAAGKGLHVLVVSHGTFLGQLTGVFKPLQTEVSVHRVEQGGKKWCAERHISRERMDPESLRLLNRSMKPEHTCTEDSHCSHPDLACKGGQCACTYPNARGRRPSKRAKKKLPI